MKTLLLILVPFLVILGIAVTVAMASGQVEEGGGDGETAPEGSRPPRPWWANPVVWALASGLFVLVGLLVAPKLFGGIFLFLPFIWMSGLGRRRPGGPRGPDWPGGRWGPGRRDDG